MSERQPSRAREPDLTGFAERKKLLAEALGRFRDVVGNDLPKLNVSLQAAGLPPLKAE